MDKWVNHREHAGKNSYLVLFGETRIAFELKALHHRYVPPERSMESAHEIPTCPIG
jgi:hypothetical protein